MLKRLLYILPLLIIAACSASTDTELIKKYPVTGFTQSDYFGTPVPRGWFSTHKSVDKPDDLLLVKDDYSVTLSVNRISVNNKVLPEDAEEALAEVAGYALLSRKYNQNIREPEVLEFSYGTINSIDYAELSYSTTGNNYYNVVVMRKFNNYVECELKANSRNKINNNRELQKFILLNLK